MQVLSPHREELERLQQAAEASDASAEDKVAPVMYLQVSCPDCRIKCLKQSRSNAPFSCCSTFSCGTQTTSPEFILLIFQAAYATMRCNANFQYGWMHITSS